jgi:hypothetical protein
VTTFAGSWVNVAGPAGSIRRDWVPSEQPASPDGSSGQWHVVSDAASGDTRWEWHPARDAPVADGDAARTAIPRVVPQDLTSNVKRGCIAAVVFGGLMPWATVGPFAITGSSMADGKVLMALALGALALSLCPRWFVVRLFDIVLAVSALLASIVDINNTSALGSKLGPLLDVNVGSGLIVCVIASGAWLATLVWEQTRPARGRRRI